MLNVAAVSADVNEADCALRADPMFNWPLDRCALG